MSVRYSGVQWNRFKLVYDAIALAAIAAFIVLFEAVLRRHLSGSQQLSEPVRHMRAFGSCAFLLLSLILSIGPLARLDRRFVPLLYNRRHLGVLMCTIGWLHAYHVLGFYHAYSNIPRFESLLTYDTAITSASLPFQLFGALALGWITLLAATSHDFWQRLLGARSWKTLHMGVYVAYALVVLHVAFGALQIESSPSYSVVFVVAALSVCGLHLAAAIKSTRPDRQAPCWVQLDGVRWLDAGLASDLPTDRARPLCVPGAERIAVVRHGDQVSAIHGVCAHQGGPLYEGKVIDGALTCPWHGWQYRPGDGCAPPPFTERIPTYAIRLKSGRVLVDPRPLPSGTAVPAARLNQEEP